MDIYIGTVVLAALGLMVPKAVLSITDVVGAANPFLAMLMIGVGVELHLDRNSVLRVVGVLLCRYSMAAVLAWVFWNFAPFEAEVRKVLKNATGFMIQLADGTIFTGMCFNDARLVALSCTINSLSIVISIACMTALILVL